MNLVHPLIALKFSLAVGILLFLSGCGQAQDQQIKRTVTILGVIEGEQQQKFEKALAPFEAENNIDVIYAGSPDFATVLKERVGTENEPDLAMFPQPGLMAELASCLQRYLDRFRHGRRRNLCGLVSHFSQELGVVQARYFRTKCLRDSADMDRACRPYRKSSRSRQNAVVHWPRKRKCNRLAWH